MDHKTWMALSLVDLNKEHYVFRCASSEFKSLYDASMRHLVVRQPPKSEAEKIAEDWLTWKSPPRVYDFDACDRLVKAAINLTSIKVDWSCPTPFLRVLAALTNPSKLLRLSIIKLTSSDDSDDSDFAPMRALVNLVELELNECEMTCDFAEALAHLTQLRRLDLSRIHFGTRLPERRPYEPMALRPLTTLTSLRLWRCSISSDTLQSLSALTNLTSLSVNDTTPLPKKSVNTPSFRSSFRSSLSALTRLVHLDLSDFVSVELLPVIGSLTRLADLRLLDFDTATDSLAPALRELTALTRLSLEYSHGGERAACFAPALTVLTGLVELGLAWNHFGPDGAMRLAWSLPALKRLRVLNLNGGDFYPEGAAALAPALATMTGLEQLSLDECCLRSLAALAPAFGSMSGLTSLSLNDNLLEDADVALLLRHLTPLTRLRRVDLHNNGLSFNSETDTEGIMSISTIESIGRLYEAIPGLGIYCSEYNRS